MRVSDRKSLLHSLRDTVEFFKSRATVGVMRTEHSIFIPSELLSGEDVAEETDEFIKASRYINKKVEWCCPVSAEQQNGLLKGIEFVFQFSKDTKFDDIIEYLEGKM
ncbi:hypothetical protein BH753_gp094 [Bacillus phage Shbh1]|uniref:Uncharacterized protein n=1 Tax=Bacillus phage Shbh1 TaxID=1796992 RepID=A0A142F1B9_9CAUD|nr:hypothetical protein BH753_gp094 [Bacillus phage Shbh1]AMQ66576.1 hypothetical protein [Bacillus phage Shbh1]